MMGVPAFRFNIWLDYYKEYNCRYISLFSALPSNLNIKRTGPNRLASKRHQASSFRHLLHRFRACRHSSVPGVRSYNAADAQALGVQSMSRDLRISIPKLDYKYTGGNFVRKKLDFLYPVMSGKLNHNADRNIPRGCRYSGFDTRFAHFRNPAHQSKQ